MAPGSPAVAESSQDEASALVRTLHETQQRLSELAGGEVDAVVHPGGHSYLLHEAQEKLRKSEASFQRQLAELQVLFDLVPAMIWFKDTENGFLRVNQRVAEVTGMAIEQIEGKSAYDIFPHEAAAYYADDLEVIRSGRPKMGIVEKLRRPDGQERWVQTDKVPYFDRDGKVIGLVAMVHDITERKEAELALRASEARFQAIFEHAAVGMCLVGMDYRFQQVNQCFCEIAGYTSEELTDCGDCIDITHPDDRAEGAAQVAKLLAGAPSVTMEKRNLRQDGGVVWVRLTLSLLRASGGEPLQFIGVMADITARRQAEVATERALQRLNEAQRLGRIGDWEWDIATQAITWSPQVFEIVGRDPSLGPPRDYEDQAGLYDAASWAALQANVTRAIESGETQTYELVVLRPDRQRVRVQAMAVPKKDEGGRVVSLYGTIQDITERKAAEARIAEQAALIDEARDAIVVRDLDHRITFWSKGAERLYGWTAAEARGQLILKLLQVDRAGFKDADRAIRTAGVWNGEIEKMAKDDRVLTVDCRWTLVRDARGEAQSILSIDTDITERKKIENQFLRAQRMESIGTLAGGIAHDINNSLAPVIMSLDLLAAKCTDPESEELLEVVSSSARRGADMVRQVLSFARGVEGERQEVQIRHLVRDLERIVSDTFPKHIQSQTSVPNDLWTVIGDATQLHQVLLNLCVNARDAMPNGGKLAISAENLTLDAHYAGLDPEAHPGAYVRIQVEDSGTGMPPEIIEKIFDPFFTTKEVGKGTGLGLSTSLAIVQSHGGFLRVYSEPGKGTTFKTYLPAQTEAAQTVTTERVVEMPRGHGELVLVVDDEPSVRVVTQQTLEAFGYRVVLANDGADAVAIYATRSAEIAVVLTDMMMPVLDGPATIQVFRKLNPKLPIIAASGLSANDYVGKLANLAVKHFLPKPYTAETLLKTLQQVLAAKRQ